MKTEEQRLLDELYNREQRNNLANLRASLKKKTKAQELSSYPDAKKHQIVSFIKSTVRIIGYVLIPFDLIWSAGILVFSEGIGIIEELV